jgi:hypothetical protein
MLNAKYGALSALATESAPPGLLCKMTKALSFTLRVLAERRYMSGKLVEQFVGTAPSP